MVWLTEWPEGPGARGGRSRPQVGDVPLDGALLPALAPGRQGRRGASAAPAPGGAPPSPDAGDAAAALLAAATGETVTEREAKAVLAAYGVPVVGERLAGEADEAVAAAAALGYPVVMKVESPDIPHKTEAGVIRLEPARRRRGAGSAMPQSWPMPQARRPRRGSTACWCSRWCRRALEIVVGARRDPLFGPMIVVGLGGILVELLRDSATRSRRSARRGAGHAAPAEGLWLLEGFRGMPAVDRQALVEVIRRVSELAADQRDRIAEIDVNPLICAGDRMSRWMG